jgi:hypothetical protein
VRLEVEHLHRTKTDGEEESEKEIRRLKKSGDGSSKNTQVTYSFSLKKRGIIISIMESFGTLG